MRRHLKLPMIKDINELLELEKELILDYEQGSAFSAFQLGVVYHPYSALRADLKDALNPSVEKSDYYFDQAAKLSREPGCVFAEDEIEYIDGLGGLQDRNG